LELSRDDREVAVYTVPLPFIRAVKTYH